MLRLFGRVRRGLLEEGASMRYVKYAAGEILLVVIGILIALQIDSWNDDRLDRQQERDYLASMQVDLASDMSAIDRAMQGNGVLLDALDDLLELIAGPIDDQASQRRLFIYSAAYTYWFMELQFAELTMTQLKNSGGLGLIRDPEVRNALLEYDKGLEDCKRMYRELRGYWHVQEARQKEIFNLALARQMFRMFEEDYLTILEPPETIDPLVPAGPYLVDDDSKKMAAYYGDVLFYRTSFNNTMVFVMNQKRMAEALDRLIQERYGP